MCCEGLELPDVKWDRSLRTGGTESPLCFNVVILAMWGAVFASWEEEGVGYELPDVHEPSVSHLVHHAVWADNVYVISHTAAQLQTQITTLTRTLNDWGMQWKRDSLELLVVGAPSEVPVTIMTRVDDEEVPFKQVACAGQYYL